MTRQRLARGPGAAGARGSSGRSTIHEVIFEAETAPGKGFQVALILVIGLRGVVVMLDSPRSIPPGAGFELAMAEWILSSAPP